ncbi:CynX/NimT family MFS transporter [Nocardia macrotermitis]|uniref:Putative transporter YycB n=1 Tax=Nocardia macrotermitis TaxID=2585198 RepID=A0A7K0D654_9NOCA|nr:MFS transporter [Nocardia macrotermitis]MQY20772.1 putative transporter YycB [Nocardia macrotermitis]
MTGQRLRLLLIVLVAVNLRPAVTAVGPLLSEIQQQLHLSSAAAGAMTTLPLVCFGLYGLIAPFQRRSPAPETLLVVAMGLLTATLLIRIIPVTAVLFAGSLVAGVAISIGNIAVPAIIKRDHPERVTAVTAIYTVAVTVGAAGASALAVPVEHGLHTSWRIPLALLAVPALAAGLAWLPRMLRARGQGTSAPGGHAELWRDRLAWQVTAFMGLQSLLAYAVIGWMPTICIDRGMGKEAAGYAVSLVSLTQAVGAMAVPLFERRLHDQRPLVGAVVVLNLLGFAGLAWAPIGSVWGWAVLLGVGQGVAFAAALSFLGLRAPDAHTARQLSGMAQGVGYLLAATGPLVLGALHDAAGGWTLPMVIMLGVAILTGLPGLAAARDRTVLPHRAPAATNQQAAQVN